MAFLFQAARLPVVVAFGLLWPSLARAATGEGAALTGILAGGCLLGGLAVVFLLVRLHRVNRRAKALDRKLSHALRQSSDGMIGLGDGGEIRMINPAARHMLGGISRDVPFLWPDTIRFRLPKGREALDPAQSPLARALAEERVDREWFDLDRRPGAGRTRRILVSCADLEDDPTGAKVLVTLSEHPEENASAKLTQATLGIMNDINNALATIAYAISLSLKHRLPEKPTSFLMTALGTVERGQNLTDEMLKAANQAALHEAPCVLAPMFERLGKAIGTSAGQRIGISFTCEDPLLMLRCDAGALERVLADLVAERAEALAKLDHTGRIWIDARVAQPSKTLTHLALLQDEGTPFVEIVISDNDTISVEAPADGSDQATASIVAEGEVSNAGLDRARAFARREGGDIRWIASGGDGNEFSLVLPGVPARDPLQSTWSAEPVQGDGETIFIVEDEASLLLMLQEELESLGYRVISATSGGAALALIEQGVDFDLVITDIVLPGETNGFDLAAKIKAQRHGAAVLYMSGYSGFDAADMGLAQAPILKKPASPYELAEAVRQALSNRLH